VICCPAIDLVHVHMVKTAGTHWRSALGCTTGMRVLSRNHAPAASLSEAGRAGMVVQGVYRPPEAWYRSLFTHALRGEPECQVALRAWTGGSMEWDDALAAWTSGEMPEAAAARPGIIWPQAQGYETPWVAGEGLWSWAMRHFFQWPDGSWAVDRLVHIDDTDACIAALGLPDRKRRNVSPEGRKPPELTQEQLDAVHQVDGALVDEVHQRVLMGRAAA